MRQSQHSQYNDAMVQKVTRGLKRKYFSVTSFGTSSSQEDTQFQDKIKVFFDNSIENVIARIGSYRTDANGHTMVSTPAVEKILHYETLLPVNIRRDYQYLVKLRVEAHEPKLYRLQELCEQFYEEVEECQRSIDDNILRRLMQPQKDKSYSKRFISLEKSKKSYAEVLCSYCAFIIRVHTHNDLRQFYTFPLNVIDESHVQNLQAELENETFNVNGAQDKLLVFLSDNFMKQYSYEMDKRTLPLMKWFLLSCNYEHDETHFFPASHMSSIVAKLLYAIRGIVLISIRKNLQSFLPSKT